MKKLSKKDRILLVVCGLIIVVITSYYGWFFWPWFGGRVVSPCKYDWTTLGTTTADASDAFFITNHSSYSQHKVFRYFRDIVLRTESDHRVHTIRKWITPIGLFIDEGASEEDLLVIQSVCEYLNSIQGFPGIHEVSSEEAAGIALHFTSGNNFGSNGYFYVDSFDENDNITKIHIYVRDNLPREKKTSVLWEELLQSTGPMNDTKLTSDTLFYGGKEDLPGPSELDRTLLEMLYHPLIKSKMDYYQCLSIFLIYMK